MGEASPERSKGEGARTVGLQACSYKLHSLSIKLPLYPPCYLLPDIKSVQNGPKPKNMSFTIINDKAKQEVLTFEKLELQMFDIFA